MSRRFLVDNCQILRFGVEASARAHERRTASLHALLLSVSLLGACGEDASLKSENQAPLAEAMLVHPQSGMTVQAEPDGSLSPVTFPYSGSPVRITLDGRNSRDPDGEVREYRWLSATRTPDAGVVIVPPLRRVPDGQVPEWPSDEATSNVEVGPGVWAFSLWVRDDEGAWSRPDTIRFVVGSPAASAMPSDAGTSAPAVMDGGIRSAVLGMDGGR
jgi:hypothetical protein